MGMPVDKTGYHRCASAINYPQICVGHEHILTDNRLNMFALDQDFTGKDISSRPRS
jgi:hypothetical protein